MHSLVHPRNLENNEFSWYLGKNGINIILKFANLLTKRLLPQKRVSNIADIGIYFRGKWNLALGVLVLWMKTRKLNNANNTY